MGPSARGLVVWLTLALPTRYAQHLPQRGIFDASGGERRVKPLVVLPQHRIEEGREMRLALASLMQHQQRQHEQRQHDAPGSGDVDDDAALSNDGGNATTAAEDPERNSSSSAPGFNKLFHRMLEQHQGSTVVDSSAGGTTSYPNETTHAYARLLAATPSAAPTSMPTVYDGAIELPPDLVMGIEERLAFMGPIAVTLQAPPDKVVHYTLDGSPPTRDSPQAMGGDSLHIDHTLCLRAIVRSPTKYTWKDSPESAALYTILTGRHGVGYFVPYYNSKPGYSGKLVSVDLVTSDYNELRIAGIRTDFGDFYSSFSIDQGLDFGIKTYKAGTGPYMGRKKQLVIRDYSELDQPAEGFPTPAPTAEPGDDTFVTHDWNSTANSTVKHRGYQGGFTAKYMRRVSFDEERTKVQYKNRNMRPTCFTGGAGTDEPLKSNLLSWLTPELADKTVFGISPSPTAVEDIGTPTLNPTVTPDSPTSAPTTNLLIQNSDAADVCVFRQTPEITDVVTNTTEVVEMDYGFIVPFFNGEEYFGTVVRLTLSETRRVFTEKAYLVNETMCCVPEAEFRLPMIALGIPLEEYCCVNQTYYTTSNRHEYVTEDRFRADNYTYSSFKKLDLADVDDELRGFVGGFSMGEYAYFVPFFDGRKYGHKVARVHVHDFRRERVQVLDLRELSTDLAGYFGGFSYRTIDGTAYGFLVPHRAAYGPVGKLNTRLTADGFTGEEVNKGRSSMGGDQLNVRYHGFFVRINLDKFEYADQGLSIEDVVDVIDLTAYDPDLRGFGGGFVAGKYGYLVPYKNRVERSGYFGKVVRINLEAFRVAGIFDLTQRDDTLTGFIGGFQWGNYGLLAPHRNDRRDVNYNKLNHHGQLVRFALGDFGTLENVEKVDLSETKRMQVPDIEDPLLRGFLGGFTAGNYTYLCPFFNKNFNGKVTRVDMRDFSLHAYNLENGLDTSLQSPDFNSEFDGVQYIDMEAYDDTLVGFAGGFSGPSSGSGEFYIHGVPPATYYQADMVSAIEPENMTMSFSEYTTTVISWQLGTICNNIYSRGIYDALCYRVYNRSTESLRLVGVLDDTVWEQVPIPSFNYSFFGDDDASA